MSSVVQVPTASSRWSSEQPDTLKLFQKILHLNSGKPSCFLRELPQEGTSHTVRSACTTFQRVWSRAQWANLRFSLSSSNSLSALALVMLSSVSASLYFLVACRLSCSTRTQTASRLIAHLVACGNRQAKQGISSRRFALLEVRLASAKMFLSN